VCQALFGDDVATHVEGELVRDVHWGNAGVRYSVNLVPRVDQAIAVLHVARDEFSQEFEFA
jgi:hypothetical protein